MKKTRFILLVLALVGTVVFTGSMAFAQDFVMLGPGESATREFYVDDVFDYGDVANGHYFVVSTVGINNMAGDMTITVYVPSKTPPHEFSLGRVIYSMTGGGVSLDGGVAPIFDVGAVPGAALSSTVSINSVFGIYILVVKIDKIIGEVEIPVPFTINFAVTKVEEPEEG
jgi:hypothetical protein